MDIILVVIVSLPVVLLYTIDLAKQGRHLAHRRWQTSLFFLVLAAVILFEVNIRLAGGSGALVKDSPFAHSFWFNLLLYCHISISVLTFALWGGALLHATKQARRQRLPGLAKYQHRTLGRFIYFGTCLTALSGLAVYLCGFVL